MADAERIGELAGEAIELGIEQTENAGDAALRAATSEVVSEINAERAEAAAQVATAAALDNGTLTAILGELGALRADIAVLVAQAIPAAPVAAPVVIVEGDETPGPDPVEIVEDVIDDGIEEIEDTGVEVEDAIAPPAGRRKRRGLMRRSRGRG